MVLYGVIWHYMVLYGVIWHYKVLYGEGAAFCGSKQNE